MFHSGFGFLAVDASFENFSSLVLKNEILFLILKYEFFSRNKTFWPSSITSFVENLSIFTQWEEL